MPYSIDKTEATEGAITFTITRDDPTQAADVDILVAHGTHGLSQGPNPTDDSDFYAYGWDKQRHTLSDTAHFNAGSSTAQYVVYSLSDGKLEADEYFTISVRGAENGNFTDTVVRLHDSAAPMAVDDTFTVPAGTVGTTRNVLTNDHADPASNKVTYNASDLAQQFDSNDPNSARFTDNGDGTFTFVAGKYNYGDDRGGQYIIGYHLETTNVDTGEKIGSDATVTINVAVPTYSVSAPAATNEGTGSDASVTTPFTFTVTRDNNRVADTVNYLIKNGTTDADDFAPGTKVDQPGNLSGSVTFAAGETSKTITVGIVQDSAAEPNETFSVVLEGSGSRYYKISSTNGTATTTILNDDIAPSNLSIAADAASHVEGNGAGTTPFTFTVTRDNVNQAASVHYSVTGDANAADFDGNVLPSGTVNFAAGEASQTITVQVAHDFAIEPNETFTVTLDTPSANAVIATASASATIVNDDAVPTTTADSYAVLRDGTLTVAAAQGVLANDTTALGTSLTVGSHTDPAKGTLSINADGSFTYTPNAGVTGTDTFTFSTVTCA